MPHNIEMRLNGWVCQGLSDLSMNNSSTSDHYLNETGDSTAASTDVEAHKPKRKYYQTYRKKYEEGDLLPQRRLLWLLQGMQKRSYSEGGWRTSKHMAAQMATFDQLRPI